MRRSLVLILVALLLLAACGGAAVAVPEALRVCGGNEAATQGMTYWNDAAGQSLFVPATDDCDVTVEIGETSGEGHIGEYHEGLVTITPNYSGWWPTHAHELGHVLGLPHVVDAAYLGVMKPIPFTGHRQHDAELLARHGLAARA